MKLRRERQDAFNLVLRALVEETDLGTRRTTLSDVARAAGLPRRRVLRVFADAKRAVERRKH